MIRLVAILLCLLAVADSASAQFCQPQPVPACFGGRLSGQPQPYCPTCPQRPAYQPPQFAPPGLCPCPPDACPGGVCPPDGGCPGETEQRRVTYLPLLQPAYQPAPCPNGTCPRR